jgi:transposase
VVADYCSDACRFKAYRIRKKKALELKAEGKKNAEIASILGLRDPKTVGSKTVGKWIGEAKAQEMAIRSRKRAGSKRRSR